MRYFATSATIHAASDVVWRLLTDAAGYPEWNRTVDRVEGRISLGERITVRVKAAPGRAFPVTVATFEAPTRMIWRGGMPLRLFVGTRTFEVRSTGANTVEFSMREEYTGLLAPLITKSIPDLQAAFDEFSACLKARAEGRN